MSQAVTALITAEHLMRTGNFESAVQLLDSIVERDPTIEALYLLATCYFQLGQHGEALLCASAAVDRDPGSAPARDLRAKVYLALGQLDSALSDYLMLAELCRQQQPTAPREHFSISAHFALYNIEQVEHILAARGIDAGAMTEELDVMRRGLAKLIGESDGEAPWVSIPVKSSRLLADPPYLRVEEERLSRYLNPAVDYGAIQHGVLAGEPVRVIDDFLTPDALAQLRKFCLESTVWRHPYKFGYVGGFPQDGFASVSLFAVVEEFLAALGEAFEGIRFAQWWGFVYDSNLPGTDIHGDDADFSLNLWITPDSANIDPDSGGLVVWDKQAPSDWSFTDYNSGGDRVRQYLDHNNAQSRVIPYRANRAVLFHGRLFHRTDGFTFAPGFVNRRRSLTFLFRRTKG